MKNIIRAIFTCMLLFSFANFGMAAGSDQTKGFSSENETSQDHGKGPWVEDIEKITLENTDFRVAKWTGDFIQLTLMSIPPGGHIGAEKHDTNDQFIRVESGRARVVMGRSEGEITFDKQVSDDWVILIPAGYWHNIYNTGETELKLYSVYGPPEHPEGTVHKTFGDSEAAHH